MAKINVRKRGKVYEYFFEGAKVNNKRTRPRPKSDSVEFYTQWKNEWIDIELTNTIKRWRNEE